MIKIFPLIFIILWSSAFVTTKPIIDNSDPFSALTFRFFFVAIGFLFFTIYSKNQTKEPHRVCSASVGIAQPKDTERYGYLSEYESFGQNELQAGDYAEDIAAQMLASSLGIPFDADKDWDEKRQQWSISGEIYNTHNVTQSTKGDKDGKWTTVFAAAVLLV